MIDFHEYDEYNFSRALEFGLTSWHFIGKIIIADLLGLIVSGLDHIDGWEWDWHDALKGAGAASVAALFGR